MVRRATTVPQITTATAERLGKVAIHKVVAVAIQIARR
jgi:hypothetical protein